MDKYIYLFSHEREPDVGKDSLKETWSSEEEEYAGSSRMVSSSWHPGMPVISEIELLQIAQIQPLILNFGEKSAIKNCFEMLQRKVQTGEILQEFMDLEYEGPSDEFSCGNEPSNRDKNRYRDILPYDSTRVPLGKNKDYINASYIKIVNSGEEYFYIATQGPLPGTISDFWQMVLENQANVIAMMSREVEDGIVKCHRYWPRSLKKPLDLKYFRIFLENYQIFQDFIIRILKVVEKTTGTVHFVKQLQFTNWPDHGTPASTDNFIKFVRLARKSHQRGPIVVHCSAGIGRTGVMLCMDVVFCAIEKNFLAYAGSTVAPYDKH
ncbi:PREDICTED: tyrosine-protein phosphatase non-receptor type 20-like [Chrysochloris asiatica]|uniref:Tyrosine-protein phosphatase non-receptor type 20-like n=1 Tax=Chrysochloris asiatica TaxID=185453 RepID=A0A9B0U9X9_CHRAS|nr:PREDICTED: tyrosine-protein phosphatase non-receptor type 20-like [Chrysochloris asiatica]